MDNLSFNITKLEEILEQVTTYYAQYKEITTNLDQEIKNLEVKWGSNDHSLYEGFKEKYDEKKGKLIEVENMMKELLDTLNGKKDELNDATVQSESSFM